jgi:predicted TIM-barrel fold metal-dependent hydrolase
MYSGPIIDSHHHLWHWQKYPWLAAPMTPKMYDADYSDLRQDYLVEDLLEDFGDHNVVKSVHVQANYDPAKPVEETAWLQSEADRTDFPHAIVGQANMTDPDIETVLGGHAQHANTRGVRHQLHFWEGEPLRCRTDRPDLCLTDEFHRAVGLLKNHNMSFELQGFSHQFVHFAALARNHPETNFCLVHGGMLTSDDDATVDAWKEGLEHLAPLPNVWIKCSGLNFFTNTCDIDHMRIVLDHVLDRFGAERCFYGSNFPLEKLWARYDDLVGACKQILASRPEADQCAFFHDTAAAFYRI